MSAGLITLLSVAFIVVFVVVLIICLVISHPKRRNNIAEENNFAEPKTADIPMARTTTNNKESNSMNREYRPIIDVTDMLELENETDALADEADSLDIQAARLGVPSDGTGNALRIVYLIVLLLSAFSGVIFFVKSFFDNGESLIIALYLLSVFFVALFTYWFISVLSTMRTALLTMNQQLIKTNKRLNDINRSLSQTKADKKNNNNV